MNRGVHKPRSAPDRKTAGSRRDSPRDTRLVEQHDQRGRRHRLGGGVSRLPRPVAAAVEASVPMVPNPGGLDRWAVRSQMRP